MKGFRKVVETIKGFINSMNKNHTTAYAAQAAIFLYFPLFPLCFF